MSDKTPPPIIETIDPLDLRVDQYYEMAFSIATKYHKGVTRWYTGEPYIQHPQRVAELVRRNGGTLTQIIVALLHDVPEDAADPAAAWAEIEAITWPTGVVRLLKLLTHDNDTLYPAYVREISYDAEASLVKCCDTIDNLSTVPLGAGLSRRYIQNLTTLHEVARLRAIDFRHGRDKL